mgnify:CR=1 FL=1
MNYNYIMAKALLIVDPQIGFINGSLPVPMAAEDMNSLASYMTETNCQQYEAKIVSIDFHPWNHCSFKSQGGEWKDHCVAHTVDSAIWPQLEPALFKTHGNVHFLTKGQRQDAEEYSLFKCEQSKESFKWCVEDYGITEIDVCGIVREICVLNTIKDLHSLYPNMKVNVLMQYTPTLDAGTAFQQFADENNWLNLIR